jgi:hypothetical protein
MNGNSGWGIPHVPYAAGTDGDGRDALDWYSYQYKPSPKYCTHEWINTGMRLVFCKKCDGKGRMDPMSGIVEFIADTEEDTNSKIKKGQD